MRLVSKGAQIIHKKSGKTSGRFRAVIILGTGTKEK